MDNKEKESHTLRVIPEHGKDGGVADEFDLESELGKPVAEIDVGLIEQEIADCCISEEEATAKCTKMLASLTEDREAQQSRAKMGWQRIASVAAVVVLLFGLTTLTAQALKWEAFLRIFAPLIELLPFGSENYDIQEGKMLGKNIESNGVIVSNEDEQTTVHLAKGDFFAANDYQLPWLLRLIDQYSFVDATITSDISYTNYYLLLELQSSAQFHVYVDEYMDVEQTVDYKLYEMNEEDSWNYWYEGYEINLFRNYDVINASWVDDSLLFTVWGKISESDLKTVVETMIGEKT